MDINTLLQKEVDKKLKADTKAEEIEDKVKEENCKIDSAEETNLSKPTIISQNKLQVPADEIQKIPPYFTTQKNENNTTGFDKIVDE